MTMTTMLMPAQRSKAIVLRFDFQSLDPLVWIRKNPETLFKHFVRHCIEFPFVYFSCVPLCRRVPAPLSLIEIFVLLFGVKRVCVCIPFA